MSQPPRATILVVDDEPGIRQIVQLRLEFNGYDVLTAENGDQALERARAAQPDLILLDVLMPGRSGYDVCRQLKADPATKHIPVVFVTVCRQDDIPPDTGVGAEAYVSKPFEAQQLLHTIETMLAGARARRAREPG